MSQPTKASTAGANVRFSVWLIYGERAWLAIVSRSGWSWAAVVGGSLTDGTATPRLGTEATEGGATLPVSVCHKHKQVNLRNIYELFVKVRIG
jgi:hypothetical protein